MNIIDEVLEAIETEVKADLSEGSIIDISFTVKQLCKMKWHEIRDYIDERFEK